MSCHEWKEDHLVYKYTMYDEFLSTFWSKSFTPMASTLAQDLIEVYKCTLVICEPTVSKCLLSDISYSFNIKYGMDSFKRCIQASIALFPLQLDTSCHTNRHLMRITSRIENTVPNPPTFLYPWQENNFASTASYCYSPLETRAELVMNYSIVCVFSCLFSIQQIKSLHFHPFLSNCTCMYSICMSRLYMLPWLSVLRFSYYSMQCFFQDKAAPDPPVPAQPPIPHQQTAVPSPANSRPLTSTQLHSTRPNQPILVLQKHSIPSPKP